MVLCSMFVLDSCEGFEHDSFHVYCCLSRTCLTYTQDAYSSLGNDLEGDLDMVSCHALNFNTNPEVAPDALEASSTLPISGSAGVVGCLAISVAALLLVADTFF